MKIDIEGAVKERYAKGALQKEEALCCPTSSYDPEFLKVIPKEIVEKDYGCGNPSKYLKEGDVVLDLGSGTGKFCFIASQIVGPQGKVIGIDFNSKMLTLAKRHQKEVGNRIGYHNVEFRQGRIQDLKPLVADESIDVIVSNCVLNLVKPEDKERLFKEMYRVLKRGGCVAISDIVSDEDVPSDLQEDPELWSGCISGAFREDLFLSAFEEAGFYGIQVEYLSQDPYRTVRGIEFCSVTVTAYKGKEGPCIERNHAVIYKGPWKQVEDDDKHVLRRGVRTAVCDKTYQIFSKKPYRDEVILIPPRKEIPLDKAGLFDCSRPAVRDPRETKGKAYRKTMTAKAACNPEEGCCS